MTSESATWRFDALVVEDDEIVAQLVRDCLEQEEGRAWVAGSIREARELCASRQFDLMILDMRLPDGSGAMLFQELHAQQTHAVGIMLTGFPDLRQAVRLTRAGLFDYLPKPFELDAFSLCVQRALGHLGKSKSEIGLNQLVGSSPAIVKARKLLEMAGEHPATTVLITGETGVGKELAAQIVHAVAVQNKKERPPLIALDCSAVPADLFESELYGAEAGAYTGAHQMRRGLVESADHGTLFLDEIGEVPLELQAKLLRFLETRDYRRIGSSTTKHFNGRIVAATNRDLKAEVEAGRFRADLWYRLDIFSIHLPPLREHLSDLPSLTEALLADVAKKHQRSKPFLLSGDLEFLGQYSFPGNVRELRNILERSLVTTPQDSSWLLLNRDRLVSGSRSILRDSQPAPAPVEGRKSNPLKDTLPPLEAQEYAVLETVMREENGVVTEVARRLGITRQAVYRRLKKWPSLKASS